MLFFVHARDWTDSGEETRHNRSCLTITNKTSSSLARIPVALSQGQMEAIPIPLRSIGNPHPHVLHLEKDLSMLQLCWVSIVTIVANTAFAGQGGVVDTSRSPHATLRSIPMQETRLTDGFKWRVRTSCITWGIC